MSRAAVLSTLVCLTVGSGFLTAHVRTAFGQEPAKPATHKIQPGPFKVEVSLDGVFEAEQVAQLILRPEVWTTYKIVRAVEAGTQVKKGDQLVWLELNDIDEALRDQTTSLAIAELDLQVSQQEYAVLEKSLPFDLTNARHAAKVAEEDLTDFEKVLLPFQIEAASKGKKMSRDQLDYVQEELRQLEKMYAADELTEETEEIILKRARNDVEITKFLVLSNDIQTDMQLKQLPRHELQLKEAVRTTGVALEKAQTTLPITLAKNRLTLEKSKFEHFKSAEKLAKLKLDRAAMEIRAPADGIVFHGHSERGQWAAPPKLEKNESLPVNSVFMSIVQPRPMFVRAGGPEKELHAVRPGITGRAVPTGFPTLRLPVKTSSVSLLPVSAATYDGKLEVELNAAAGGLLPGMTCKLTLVAYAKPDALTVPAAAVFTDETDDSQQHVFVYTGPGAHEKRPVTVDHKTEKLVEITAGLKAGDEVLLEDPTAKK